MNFRGHCIIGIIFIAALLALDKFYFHYFFIGSLANLSLVLPIVLLSFVIPDVDHDESIPRFVILAALAIMAVYSFIYDSGYFLWLLGCFVIAFLLPRVPGWHHRGHAHSIIFIAILSLLVMFGVGWKIAILFAVGALSHLVADGIPFKIW